MSGMIGMELNKRLYTLFPPPVHPVAGHKKFFKSSFFLDCRNLSTGYGVFYDKNHFRIYILYLVPVGILLIGIEFLSINFNKYIEAPEILRQILNMVFLVYAMVFPGYRAKLASEAYGDRDMTLWEAHTVSGVMLRTHLSFLPVIGFLFYIRKENTGNNNGTNALDEKNRFDELFDK